MIWLAEELSNADLEMKNNGVIWFFSLLFWVISCSKNKEASTPDLGLDYFPLATGNFRIYQLDSLFYNDFTGKVDSFHFQVKELVGDSFSDGAGVLRYRIERYYRKKPADSWRIADVWSATVNSSYASVIEENIHRVKLSFPVKAGRQWNMNSFNPNTEEPVTYDFVGTPQARGGISYNQTLRTSLPSDSSLINQNSSVEEYAKGIGMIYKKYVMLEDRDSVIDFSKPFPSRVDYGFDVTYTLIEYGKN